MSSPDWTPPNSATSAALNRIADALFTQAKCQKQQNKTQERLVAVQEQLLVMQKANLAVTKQLEAALTSQTTNSGSEHVSRRPPEGALSYVQHVFDVMAARRHE